MLEPQQVMINLEEQLAGDKKQQMKLARSKTAPEIKITKVTDTSKNVNSE